MRINSATASAAAEVLDLELEGLTADAVSAAYRKASKDCHPNGGNYNPERWAAITDAKAALERWLQAVQTARPAVPARHGACRACGGAGFVQKRQGFYTGPRFVCVMCQGTGNPKKQDQEE